ILLAGQLKGEFYWFDAVGGRFVTSTFYRDEYPAWIEAFNNRLQQGLSADTVWASTVPSEVAHLSGGDTAAYERDGIHTFFPHRYLEEADTTEESSHSYWWELTPMLDAAVLDLARTAVRALDLGGGEHLDFLAVSLSQTDRVGHEYGPLSREQLDNLLRLDRELGNFFDFLDGHLGADRYLVGFASDHGTAIALERLQEMGLEGSRLTAEHRVLVETTVNEAIREAQTRAGDSSTRDEDPLAHVVDRLQDLPFAGPAYSVSQLQMTEPPDSFRTLFRNSYVPGRMGGILSRIGIEFWWGENVLGWSWEYGTTHGSPYLYDRHVPFVLMGSGIEPGRIDLRVATVDMAPTLAHLVGVPFPDDLDGRPLVR
ncbi:MAG: alkaline phosphatase family protein, partial [Gemmatimonadetes bacterium]|nr:alkaline phosphatase family protein [Gemmatimonadota bacterium]